MSPAESVTAHVELVLESDGVRLVHVEGEWTCPVGGATRHLAVHDAVEASRRSLVQFES